MARSKGDGGCGCILLFIVLFFLYDTVSSCMSDDQGPSYAPTQPAPTFSFPLPSIPPGHACRDGWISHSTGRGTCSHHGGEL